MKPEYEKYLIELIDESRKGYSNGSELSDRDILRNQCKWFAYKFRKKFPHLVMQPGFVNNMMQEHIWLKDVDGTIIDPTWKQWHAQPTDYVEYDENVHEIYLGRCANCGNEIYGLQSAGGKGICSEECADSYERYLNTEIRRLRG